MGPIGAAAIVVAAPLLLAWSAEQHGDAGAGAAHVVAIVIAGIAALAATYISHQFAERDFEKASA
jgi:hypothetical protein